MTKTHKVVSDMSVQLSEQVLRATKIDKIQTYKLCKLTNHILRESVKRRIESKPFGTITRMGILCVFNAKKLKKVARLHKIRKRYLDNSLDKAIRKIKKTNAKKMFKVIEMNMKYGPEKTIDHVVTSFTEIENIEIIDLKLLEGTVRKKS